MPTYYLRIRADYDKTKPFRCGNLECLAILEPPFESVTIAEHEELFCVNCLDQLKTVKALEVHVE